MRMAYFFMAVSFIAAVGIVYTYIMSRRQQREAELR